MWFKKKTAEEITQINQDRRKEIQDRETARLKSKQLTADLEAILGCDPLGMELHEIIERLIEHIKNDDEMIFSKEVCNELIFKNLCKEFTILQKKADYLEDQRDVIFDILRKFDKHNNTFFTVEAKTNESRE